MKKIGATIEIVSFVHNHLANRPRPDGNKNHKRSSVARTRELAAACGARLITGGTQPAYDPVEDVMYMPSPAFYGVARLYTFKTTYAICILHELVHWSGHRTRLARPAHKDKFDIIYRREECLAEMGSALLCHDLGITSQPTLPHARYLNEYLSSLPNPAVELDVALARANAAVGYIHALSRSGAGQRAQANRYAVSAA